MAPFRRRARNFNKLTSLNAAKNTKVRIYEPFSANSASGRLMTVPISALGGLYLDIYALLSY